MTIMIIQYRVIGSSVVQGNKHAHIKVGARLLGRRFDAKRCSIESQDKHNQNCASYALYVRAVTWM
jgi:hypothetical protein